MQHRPLQQPPTPPPPLQPPQPPERLQQEPIYHYKYSTALQQRQQLYNEPVYYRGHACTFIDPETGIIYERCPKYRTHELHRDDNYRTYRCNASPIDLSTCRREHLYHSLEPQLYAVPERRAIAAATPNISVRS